MPQDSAGPDRPLQGIALILGAMLCFSTSDTLAKFLSDGLPAIQMAWMRYTVFVLFAAILLRVEGGKWRLSDAGPQILRGVSLVGSAICFMISLRSLPIAEAAAIGFSSPAIITVLAVLFLGERPGWRRWLGVMLGLLGVVVVVRPGTAAFQPAALWGLASSVSWAVSVIVTRRMAKAHAPSMLLWSAVSGWVLLSFASPFVAVWPSQEQVALTFVMGVFAASGQYLMILAYRRGDASLLAPFSYTQLLWAIVAGYFVFVTLPDSMTVLGAAIIAGSGVWSARSERAKAAR